jgi:transposase
VDVIVERCAGLDVHKKTVMACVRKPGDGERVSVKREFSTFTHGLHQLRDWLASEGVTQVAMEATGVYWRPVWYVVEEMAGVELLLANAQHVKNLPGRKTDAKDAEWLGQLLECGLLRGSFVPTPVMQRLRNLTRYRNKLTQDRGREVQRIQKVLEDAGIKLDSVISDVLGKSSRQMLEALIAGERDPEALAEMSKTRMRAKIPDLRLALVGRFGEHHALMARMHLDHIDHLDEMIDRLDQEVAREMAPFAVDMSRFPTAAHLASWAGMCPGNHESAGKSRSGRHRKGNAALQALLCEAAWAASHTKDTYLAAQYQRFLRRFGKKGKNKAIFALAHTILVIIWNILSKGGTYEELGYDYFERRIDTEEKKRRLIRQLESLGLLVTVEPAA